MGFTYCLGVDVSDQSKIVTLANLIKTWYRSEKPSVYYVLCLEQHLEMPIEVLTNRIVSIVTAYPYLGRMTLAINEAGSKGMMLRAALKHAGLWSPAGFIVGPQDEKDEGQGGSFIPEEELVRMVRTMYQEGRLHPPKEQDGEAKLLVKAIECDGEAHDERVSLLRSTALACWLAEQQEEYVVI